MRIAIMGSGGVGGYFGARLVKGGADVHFVARGDAAVEIMALLVILLPSTNDELALLDRYVELVAGEARDCQRDPQAVGLAVGTSDPLDVVGRIAVGSLGDAIERTLYLVEPEQEWAGQRRNSGHGLKALVSDFDGALAAPPRPSDGRVFHPRSVPLNMGGAR